MPNAVIEAKLSRLATWTSVTLVTVVGLLLVLFVVVILIAERALDNTARVNDAVQSNVDTICALLRNAESQVAATRAFIKLHPKGISGISADDLNQSLQRQRDFLAALRSGQVHCS